jgi:hypothetical protein
MAIMVPARAGFPLIAGTSVSAAYLSAMNQSQSLVLIRSSAYMLIHLQAGVRDMATSMKASVSTRAVVQRINRVLKHDMQMLKATRGEKMRQAVGDFHVIDFSINGVTHTNVDPESFARDLGVLKPWEKVAAE